MVAKIRPEIILETLRWLASDVSDIFQMASSSTNLNMGIANDKTSLGNDLKRKNNMQSPQGCVRG